MRPWIALGCVALAASPLAACDGGLLGMDAGAGRADASLTIDARRDAGPADARIDAPITGSADAAIDARPGGAIDARTIDAAIVDAAPAADACPVVSPTAPCADTPASGFGSSGLVITGAVVRWSAMALDATSIYLAGSERVGSGDSGWRVEKRDLTTGDLAGGFGQSGILRTNPSGFLDRLDLIVIDGTSMYLAGSDASAGATAPRWRVEKRTLDTGAAVTGFGDQGKVILSPMGLDLGPQALARDATAVYVAGRAGGVSTTPQEWIVYKLALSDGAPVTGFGDTGVLRAHTAGTGTTSIASAVVVSGTELVLAGWTAGTVLVEKRSTTSGALVGGFGTGGVATVGDASGEPSALAVGGSALYLSYPLAGGLADVMNTSWVVEKRSLSTGERVAAFGGCGVLVRDPTTGADELEELAVSGDDLHLIAVDDLGAGGAWRWERRSATSGALSSLCKSNTGSQAVGEPPALALTSDGSAAIAAGTTDVVTQEGAGRIEKRVRGP